MKSNSVSAIVTNNSLRFAGGSRRIQYVKGISRFDKNAVLRNGSVDCILPVNIYLLIQLRRTLWPLQDDARFRFVGSQFDRLIQ